MAVPTEKIKARLRALFPKANLSQKRIDAIAAKLALKPADDADDAAIDVVINAFNDVMSFEDIAREDDRVRNLENNQKAPTPAPAPEPAPTPTPAPATGDDPTTALLKTLTESVNKLTGEVTAIKEGKVLDTKKSTAIQAVQASEVFKAMKPEQQQIWANRIDLNSETPFEDQVKAFETELTELMQSTADSTSFAGQAPKGAGGKNEPSAKEVDDIVASL